MHTKLKNLISKNRILCKISKVSSRASIILTLALASIQLSYADTYKIKDVEYDITGQTRPYAVQTKVPVDKKTVFQDEDELMEYISDFKKRLENTRAFESVEIDITLEKDETDVASEKNDEDSSGAALSSASTENQSHDNYFVSLKVTTKDSLHILGAPYPKFDSNNGFSFKLKLKDTNFLGSLETMATDFNFNIETKEDDTTDYKFGFAIDFDIPFKLSIFDATWINEHSVSYTIGDETPEWDLKTGLALELPFEKFSIKLEMLQSFIRNLEYEDKLINGETVHYGDGTYFVENADLSIPIIIQEIPEWGKIYYTPFVEAKYYWDKDGISEENEDLSSPVFTIGQTISTSRINWIENFRNGLSAKLTQSYAYNVQAGTFIPGFSAEITGYKATKYVGFCTDIYAFAYLNGKSAFGSRLRGIRDKQYYSKDFDSGDPDDENEYWKMQACESPSAIVMNFDMPIHIFTAYWDEMKIIQKIPGIRKIAKYFNMELQLSPFLDIALTYNRATKRILHYKDGFYAAGIEALIYPKKWKGIEVRGSLGVDLSQKLPGLKGMLDQSWRDSDWKEISIGIGLHY